MSIKMKARITIDSITRIKKTYPAQFVAFCAQHDLHPPKPTSKNGKALSAMLHNLGRYWDRASCDDFVKKFNITTRDSIQLFNKHEQWGIRTSRERGKNYILFPFQLSMKHTMVLVPCSFEQVPELDLDKLRQKLKDDYLTPGRIEFYNASSTKNYVLDGAQIEYIVSKVIDGGTWVAEGNSPTDVIIKKTKTGIDVTCVCCNSNMTNEKSIMQNFKGSGNSLDLHFENGTTNLAIDLYKKELYNKLTTAGKTYELENLYCLIFISIRDKIYLSLLKFNIDAILNVTENGLSKGKKSIMCSNFIDEKFGRTKIYKSKKRFEIRFCKSIIDNDNTVRIY
jgi:hypothetical protein